MNRVHHRLVTALSAAALLLLAGAVQQPQDQWQLVDGNWSGGSTAPIWKMTVWPGKDLLIASTRSNGLWQSADAGDTWTRMGAPGKTPANAGQACTFVFDPTHPLTFWTAGMYGYAIWKTVDGGKTFSKLGKFDHVDGISVDFSDPKRQTLLIGLHEAEHSIHRSTDGGVTWEKIGDRLPPDAAFTSDPMILGPTTYISNAAGYKKEEKWGIHRSTDSGKTWSVVSTEGASGNATITSNGDNYWSVLWDRKIIKSTDNGATWTRLNNVPVRGQVIETSPNHLVALGGKDLKQLHASADGGAAWTPLGPPLPFKPHGFTYIPARHTFVVWKEHDNDKPRQTGPDGEIVRWVVPGL